MTNPHEIEEQEFGQGPRLWDAGEGVCCAAFQLGACAHTEAALWDDYDDDYIAEDDNGSFPDVEVTESIDGGAF